jgi:hypothetical protein
MCNGNMRAQSTYMAAKQMLEFPQPCMALRLQSDCSEMHKTRQPVLFKARSYITLK